MLQLILLGCKRLPQKVIIKVKEKTYHFFSFCL